jgi:hypothetical protein
MTTSKRSTRWTVAVVVVVVLACLLLGLVFGPRYFQRGRDYLGRPLVLIDSPASGERLPFGQNVPAIALARSDAGITRMELWAEGKIVAAQEAPTGETLSPMTLAVAWNPTTLGPHRVTVRAFTRRGVGGYASVDVEVVEAATALGSHTVAEGESLEDIAVDYGIAPDELAELNPDLPAGGPAAGSELIVPLSGIPSDEPPPSEASGEPALEAADEPAPEGQPGGAGESSRLAGLRLEALDLRTDAGYESLHCYAAVGGRPPRWYPDADGDPATDESFAPMSGTHWDIAAHFSGSEAPLIFWPGDADLPFDITCVGVRAGGTDAVELGHLALAIPPASWDGERRRASAEGEGGFEVEYLVGFADLEPKGLDSGMAVPQNLRYDDRRQSLRWEYAPNTEPEAEPEIDGFLVFLNDNLVFELDADERESRLPEAWLVPPCGEEYVFSLRAYHRPYPDGAYSNPSNTVLLAGGEAGSEACNREFLVTFRRLSVYDMGDDGDDDPRGMGPISGFVDANTTLHSFGNPPSVTIFNNSNFNLDTFFWDDYAEANTILIPLAEEDDLRIGFVMDDNDTRGWYDNSICAGGETLHYSELLSGPVEGSFDATRNWEDEVRCTIEYTIEPAPGSPVGVAGGGLLLPWLDLTDVTLDEATDELQLHITNTGTAAWANQDLDVRVTNRDGQETGTHTWPLFYLDPLAEVVLQDPSLTAESPEAACVHLDYNDRVLESLENTGVLSHGPRCQSLSDLVIDDVQYEADDSQLQVTIRNISDGPLEDRVVSVDLLRPDGSQITTPLRPTVALLEHNQSTTITWPSIDSHLREAMLEGYTVRLNAEGRLLEEDLTNNDFAVPAGETVWVVYRGSTVTAFYRDWLPWWAPYPTHHFVVGFSVNVAGGESSQRIGNWSQDFDWEPETDDERHYQDCSDCYTEQVAVGGDEQLLVGAAASVRKAGSATREQLGSWTYAFDIQDPDATYPRYSGTECLYGQQGYYDPMVDGVNAEYAGGYSLPRDWGVSYCVFRLRE